MPLADLDLTGQIIDRRFRVERLLGSGGMGTVWRAQHVQSLQFFALKTLRVCDELPESAIQRCLKEARAAAALRSRHVVRVTDVQSNYLHGGVPLPYLVMELLEGMDFESVLIERNALKVAETAWVLHQLCRGIQLAHDHGVIHRDLKPANLFLTTDDEGVPVVKICDFGLAKIADVGLPGYSQESSARPGSVVGTPRYMAPEQLRGAAPVTPALDQWAIGLIAYRLLSGQDYFDGAQSALELSLRIVHDQLPAPSVRSPLVPSSFDEWFFRSCDRDPNHRHVSVQCQADDLQLALGDPVAAAIMPSALCDNAGSSAETIPSSNAALVASPPNAIPRARTGLLTTLGLSAATGVVATVALAATLQWLVVKRFGSTPNITDTSVGREKAIAPVAPLQVPSSAEVMKLEPAVVNVQSKPFPASSRKVERSRPAPASQPGDVALSLPPFTSSASMPSLPPTVELVSGTSCSRSSQCASRLCVAERCR